MYIEFEFQKGGGVIQKSNSIKIFSKVYHFLILQKTQGNCYDICLDHYSDYKE